MAGRRVREGEVGNGGEGDMNVRMSIGARRINRQGRGSTKSKVLGSVG